MSYAKLDEKNRVVNMMREDPPDGLPEEMKDDWVYFDNIDDINGITLYDQRDLVVSDGKVRYEPSDETIEKIERDEKVEIAREIFPDIPEIVASTDDAMCSLYETAYEQSVIIDQQDAAICALYEMLGEQQ